MALPTRVLRGQIDPMNDVQRDFEGLMNRFFGARGGGEDGGHVLAPYAVDVREDADHIYVEAELPGFRKEDVDITLENQTLTIAAERRSEKREGGEKKGELLLNERRYSRFLRSFTLPPTVDESKCIAKLADGVLTITLNKREETKPRKVTVGSPQLQVPSSKEAPTFKLRIGGEQASPVWSLSFGASLELVIWSWTFRAPALHHLNLPPGPAFSVDHLPALLRRHPRAEADLAGPFHLADLVGVMHRVLLIPDFTSPRSPTSSRTTGFPGGPWREALSGERRGSASRR